MALPKTTDPSLPNIGGLGYVGDADTSGYITIASGQYFRNASNLWVPVSDSNPLPSKLLGSFATMRTPITGIKTVTATAAEIFAGSSRLSGRRKMILKNEDMILRFLIGPSGVTQQNGFPIEPGAIFELDFDPTVDVPIYAISEGANLNVAVMEI
jgi:hypothetical protein